MENVTIAARRDLAARVESLLRAKPKRVPRKIHREHVATAMTQAHYRVLNLSDAFCRELEELFLNFSETAAERFAMEKRLPRRAAKDLWWSYCWWKRTGKARLYCGMRSYPWRTDARRRSRRLGFYHYPPRLRARGGLHHGALRLHRRASGWSWERISRVESLARSGDIDEKSVRDSVNRWAAILGVQLPTRAAGRPPKP